MAVHGAHRMRVSDAMRPFAAALVIALVVAGCGGGEAGPTLPRRATWEGGVAALFRAECVACHNGPAGLGGWDASAYQAALESGANGPAVVAGDPDASLLVEKMRGTQSAGVMMPPAGLLEAGDIDLVVDWIRAGAPES